MADPFFMHPSAIVDPGAQIGEGTKIWHFTHVSAGAKIGKNCVLGQNVFIAPTVTVGEGVHIQNNVSLYDGVTIDAFAFIGPSAVFTNVVNPRSEVPRKDEIRTTTIGRGVTIGANATVLCGLRVGAYAFVGAGAVITAHIPAYALVFGVPARQFGWMCRCGEQLTVESGAAYCAVCGRGYRSEGEGLVEA